ncbi:iron-containing alcohol dehydrogenase family protein [Tepidibacillus marianensis]|uniref:iron-containing alcohol dehydrogenase family protein n=1 Tax=Tepidibacillus marianensis TaxID=3131995 RepID=UPI0030D0CD50
MGVMDMHPVQPGSAKYINEPKILLQLHDFIRDYGTKPFVLSGEKAFRAVENNLDLQSYEWTHNTFKGECSYENIHYYAEKVLELKSDVIIAIGGGKVIDTAKAIGDRLNLPVITIPTVASTCASWTPLSVIYTQEGTFIEYIMHSRGPSLVLVDPTILIESPIRYFVAGIGDTFAKYYEASALCQNQKINAAARAGLEMAKLTYSILFEESEEALKSIKKKAISQEFSDVLDAIFMTGGLVGGLGDKYGRIAAAHSIHNGLTNVPQTHHLYHGEKVAYGIFVQLILENRPFNEINQLIKLFQRLQLPVSFNDLGITSSELDVISVASCQENESIHLMPFAIDQEKVKKAMEDLEKMVN